MAGSGSMVWAAFHNLFYEAGGARGLPNQGLPYFLCVEQQEWQQKGAVSGCRLATSDTRDSSNPVSQTFPGGSS